MIMVIGFLVFASFTAWALWPLFKSRQIWLLLVLSCIALGLYGVLGGAKQIMTQRSIEKQAAQLAITLKEDEGVENLIAQLKKTAQAHPDDAQAWYWLGRMHMRAGQSTEAKHALAKAHELVPKAAVVTFHYAMAIIAENRDQFDKESIELLKAISNDPELKPVVNLWLQRASQQIGVPAQNSSDDAG